MTNGSVALFGDDLDKGFENMTQQDLALPFIRILGQLSPQVTEGDSKYVTGAKPGMIYNTVTNELYDGKKELKLFLVTIRKTIQSGLIEEKDLQLRLHYMLLTVL